MKKLIAIALAVVLVLTVGSGVALAKAQKVDLNPYDDGGAGFDPGTGFVVLNNSTGGAELQVSLKGAVANDDYYVYISGDSGVSWDLLGTMTTNGKGNANFHMNWKDVPAGTYTVEVALNRVGATRFMTPVVTLTIK